MKVGNSFNVGHRRDHEERDHRDLHAIARVLLVELLAPRLQVGDVGLVVVGDVRDHHPVAGQHRARDPLDPRALARARPRRTSRSRSSATAADRGPGRFRPAAPGAAAGSPCDGRTALGERLHVLLGDPSLAAAAGHLVQIDAELAGDPAHGGAGVDRAAAVAGRRRSGRGGRGRRRLEGTRADAGGSDGAGPDGGAAPAPDADSGGAAWIPPRRRCRSPRARPPRSARPRRPPRPPCSRSTRRHRRSATSVSSSTPRETLSPTLTSSSPTVPGNGAGTSIVALSDSSVSSGSSTATVSPGETRISMIGTSSKSPMSGTSTATASDVVLIRSSASGRRCRSRSARSPPCTRAASTSPLVGQLLQRRHRDVVAVDLEEPAQRRCGSRCGRSRRSRARDSAPGTHWRI